MEASLLDTAGTVIAIVLTLFVFSYLLGDNVLYRLAEHLFVGTAVGYAAVVAFHSVIAPKLISPLTTALTDGDWNRVLLLGISLAFGLFLLTKPTKRFSWLGNLSVALLMGVGAALAIGGALLGTLIPQVDATADVMRYTDRYGLGLGLFSGLVVLTGAIGVLLHFYFGAEREGRLVGLRKSLVQVWGGAGRWFILVAFAAIFATTFMSRLSVLIGRIQFLVDGVRGLLGG
ncbi:MAG: hypothetical protein ACK2UC_08360 [Anaerolineae bacterium]|jgi:hypothetical protein